MYVNYNPVFHHPYSSLPRLYFDILFVFDSSTLQRVALCNASHMLIKWHGKYENTISFFSLCVKHEPHNPSTLSN